MKKFEEISAEVILKSQSGRSLADTDVITAENIDEFMPTAETISEAKRHLQELGFTVVQSGVTLTIMGKLERFKEVFKVEMTLEKDEQTGNVTVHSEGESVIPDSLKNVVENVVFLGPPELF